MKDDNRVIVKNGVSFLGLLFIVLLALKLANFIDISWFWIFFPLLLSLVPLVFFLIIVVITAIASVIVEFFNHRKSRRSNKAKEKYDR